MISRHPLLRQREVTLASPSLPNVEIDLQQTASKAHVHLCHLQVHDRAVAGAHIKHCHKSREDTLLPSGVCVECRQSSVVLMPRSPHALSNLIA